MTRLRLLVAEGDAAEGRARNIANYGETFSAAYVSVLEELAKAAGFELQTRVVYPADPGAGLPGREAIADFDGVVLTGSSLHLWKAEPESLRQVEFARAVFAARTPFFGSCWGLQVAAAAAGGSVRKNPRGREIGFARNIALTAAGREHPMHRGKPASFSAPSIHLDEIETLPPGAVVTAANGISDVQAAEIQFEGGAFWGVQYHPEYTLSHVAEMLRCASPLLIKEGFYGGREAMDAHLAEIETLAAAPSRRDVAWRLGLDQDVLDPRIRLAEVSNWIARLQTIRA